MEKGRQLSIDSEMKFCHGSIMPPETTLALKCHIRSRRGWAGVGLAFSSWNQEEQNVKSGNVILVDVQEPYDAKFSYRIVV
jgi:hypothetical protein